MADSDVTWPIYSGPWFDAFRFGMLDGGVIDLGLPPRDDDVRPCFEIPCPPVEEYEVGFITRMRESGEI